MSKAHRYLRRAATPPRRVCQIAARVSNTFAEVFSPALTERVEDKSLGSEGQTLLSLPANISLVPLPPKSP
ncbi:MAG: hypothetical protein JO047_02340 [Alphaproteobacteria bacterium]|nr:hypothetical protein [Alphaproteobacteria bacterium]